MNNIQNNQIIKNIENKITPIDFGDNSICIPLDLGKFIEGLCMDFTVIKEGEGTESFVILSLNETIIAFYPIGWPKIINSEDKIFDIHAKLLEQVNRKKIYETK